MANRAVPMDFTKQNMFFQNVAEELMLLKIQFHINNL